MIGNVLMTDESGTTKSAYDDFNLIIKHKVINSPDPQLHKIEVVGRDGVIDLTDSIAGQVKFEERSIELSFRFLGKESERTAMVSEFLNFVYGKRISYNFNDDVSFVYIGRMTSCVPEVDGAIYDLETEIVVEPYKRTAESTAEEWLWDSFDFELGVINEFHEINVPANEYVGVTMVGTSNDNPIVTAIDANIQGWYDIAPEVVEQTGIQPHFVVDAGNTRKIYSVVILTGEHWFTFKTVGNTDGAVTVDYRGGSL